MSAQLKVKYFLIVTIHKNSLLMPFGEASLNIEGKQFIRKRFET